ncbi:SGNH/GDSL hydrolase family protein [bacterium]|nr:SGNH/GDSL hydrolase family protein [bacterium]
MNSKSQNFFLSIFAFLLCFLFCEFATRIYTFVVGKGFLERKDAFTSSFFTTYEQPPPKIEKNQGVFTWGERVKTEKEPDEFRVICLGGSTTACKTATFPYSKVLEDSLKLRFPNKKIRVLNAGADAYSTAQTLVNFALRVIDFQPDLITVYHNINDNTARNFGDFLLPDYSNKYLDDFFLAYEHRTGFFGNLLGLSRFLQLVDWRLQLLFQNKQKTQVANLEKGQKIFRRNIESILAVARQNGISVVLGTMAFRDGESGSFKAYNDEIRACGKANNVLVADVSLELSGKKKYFIDEVHFSDEGVKAIGNIFVPIIFNELRLKEN